MQNLLKGLIGIVGAMTCLAGPLNSAESQIVTVDPNRIERTEAQMGVSFRIVVYATDPASANKAIDCAYARIEELNAIYSDYDPHSELSRLSETPNRQQKVSNDLCKILQITQQISRKSDGAFDITVGPYVRLWRRARRQKELPSQQRLQEARNSVGFQYLQIEPCQKQVKLLRENMLLDLGGIAKGYAADEAMHVLKQHGISSALIDASGDILVSDPPPGEKGWKIGIAALNSPDGQPQESLLVANRAVATSGDAYQYVEINGVRYSHIVNPHTGMGLTTHNSVTVVAPNGTLADAWASAVSVMGAEKGLRVLSHQKGISALVLTLPQGRPHSTRSCNFPATVKAASQ